MTVLSIYVLIIKQEHDDVLLFFIHYLTLSIGYFGLKKCHW